MSIIEKILGIRPKNNDAASLRKAMKRTDENLALVKTRIAELERNRGALMLRGTAAEMKTGEDDLAAARLDADRLDSLRKMLEVELPAAEQREFIEGLKREIEDAKALRAEFVRRWRKDYAGAAQKIAELLHLEMRVEDARGRATSTAAQAHGKGIDIALVDAALVGFPGTSVASEINPGGAAFHPSLGGYCRLPGAETGSEHCIVDYSLWPPRGRAGQA